MSPKTARATAAFILFLFSGLASRAELGFSETELRDREQVPQGYFGWSVAVSGDTALVGALNDDAVYVFVRQDGAWAQQARLSPDPGPVGIRFGLSVALSGDTAVVGAPFEDVGQPGAGGAVYVFVRRDGVWEREAKLTAGSFALSDAFGYAVDVSGNVLVAGIASLSFSAPESGAAEVFVRRDGAWTRQAQLTAPDGRPGDFFGGSVAVSGGRVLVTARRYDVGGVADAGAAFVFVRNGRDWDLEARLTASDPAPFDRFGTSVDLAGNTAVVGAWLDNPDEIPDAGAAYVFVREDGAWTEQAKLTAPDAETSDQFGSDVAVSGDTVAIGAWREDARGDASGSAYLFRRQGEDWNLFSKLTASDTQAHDQFGFALALEGDTLVVGAFGASEQQFDSGSAYVFAGPFLRVVATPAEQTVPAGGVAPLTITVRNFGSSRLRNVQVNVAPSCSVSLGTLFPGQRKRVTCPVTTGSAGFTFVYLVFVTATPLEGPPIRAVTSARVVAE
ncbi:MAG TPA: FG-GAP repeat protein [Thermoanaerobaculia bacterium]